MNSRRAVAVGAAFAGAAASHERIAIGAPTSASVGPLVEGALLARYRYDVYHGTHRPRHVSPSGDR
ncbi:MAG: hypothetical protein LH650_02850 [Chloroflexi bacterium]|nr:hypothetical protein [Chloroflexota bacterium]